MNACPVECYALAGPNRAKEFMMLGTLAGADEALRLGLVNRVVEPDDGFSTRECLAKDRFGNWSAPSHSD